MKYLKFMPFRSMEGASRNRREILAAKQYGFDVAVFSTDNTLDTVGMKEIRLIRHDVSIIRKTDKSIMRKVKVLLRYYQTIKQARKLDYDVWSCHDLESLFLAFLAKRRRRCKLIYDSHEFEIGRNCKRNKLRKLLVKAIERYCIKRCSFTIVVSEGIANRLVDIFKLKQRPVVVRSTPDYWNIDSSVCQIKREEMLSKMSDSVTSLVMFHGNLGTGNGIEKIIPSVAENNKIGVVFLGNRVSSEINKILDAQIKNCNLHDRVLFMDAVSYEDIWKYVGAVDLELMLIEPIVESYYYSLPNKLFESIQSETPCIASKIPEMKKIIDEYHVGICCDLSNDDEIRNAINKMLFDDSYRNDYKKSLKIAKMQLCWQMEVERLFEAYKHYLA